jgi:hypothetical protein
MRNPSLRALRRRPRSARGGLSLVARLLVAWRAAPWWAPTAAALLIISIALSGATNATTAHNAHTSATHPWIGRATPPNALPPIARWQDIQNGTAYAVHVTSAATISARGGNLFTFTAPSGDEVEGLVPLSQLPDQSYAQATSQSPAVLGGCQVGVLRASRAVTAPAGAAAASATQPVEFSLAARFDQYLLVAYAQVLYAPVSDKVAVSAVCNGTVSAAGVTSLTMSAGCTASACGSPLDSAMTAPPGYEQAVVHAMKARGIAGWSAVWNLTARTVTAQYSQADFAALMNQLSDKVGAITAMTPTSGPPTIRFDSGGQAYFTLTENVTYTRGGTSTTTQITSYYLLEGGQWRFWFSAAPSA